MSREDPQLKLRLTEDMKARITAAAVANKRSVNAEIVDQLERHDHLASELAAVNRELAVLREENATLEFRANEVFELRKRGWDRARGIGLDGFELPDGLSSRIEATAESRKRSKFEEIVQALEAAFPAAPTLNEFYEQWLGPLDIARGDARERLLAEANAEAKAHWPGRDISFVVDAQGLLRFSLSKKIHE